MKALRSPDLSHNANKVAFWYEVLGNSPFGSPVIKACGSDMSSIPGDAEELIQHQFDSHVSQAEEAIHRAEKMV